MSKIPIAYSSFNGGIADFITQGIDSSYAFGRSIDIRSDPKSITVLPRTIKESGTVIIDLPKWLETYGPTLSSYIYGAAGNMYRRTSAGSYTNLRTVANSHGNGLVYSAEDDYLYYSLDKVIGRYGPLSGTPTFTDDFFGSLGGVPLNTNAVDFEASSSQYASRADTASLSITGNIAMDIQIKPESLPTVGNQMVLMSKWDESGSLRSYKFDINTASGYFGDGSDGALVISSNTTEAPIDSACTGTVTDVSLSATNASFATGQIILIHQTQGTGAGNWMRNSIQSYTAGTITLTSPLNATYGAGAQVRVLKQYTNVTVNSGITYSAKAWNGTVGGIIAFIASGTVNIQGTINAAGNSASVSTGGIGIGFDGGTAQGAPPGEQGDSTTGAGIASSAANGMGGGGSGGGGSQSGAGGGGHAIAGSTGGAGGGTGGVGGGTGGSADLTTMVFGGGGGGADQFGNGAGGGSGGIAFITGATLTVSGAITANGGNGTVGGQQVGSGGQPGGGGGGGAGGSILLKAQTATLGSGLITATGGNGGIGGQPGINNGGNGGAGRVHIDYYTSYTGDSSPTIDATQDNSLVTNTSYQLRLSISSTGANSETLAQVANIQTGIWQQVGVSWEASSKTATFYLNAVPIGTRVGALGAIHDNASTFQVAMSKNGAGAAANFYDGLMDEARLFNTTRSDADMLYGLNSQISTNTSGLVAYYKFNGDYTDATTNTNNLTATNSPTFTSDVPYPSPTTRLDIDQSSAQSGDTYAVPTSISEATADRKTFTPAKDPQKSIQFNVAAGGSGDWTVTIHDSSNNVIATSTVSNSNMHTGNYEFMYSSIWSPLTNFTNEYHAHITSTVADGTVVTDINDDLETADFVTYYQFLMTDNEWHPMGRLLNFWVVGNGRYVGKYEAPLYEPNKIVFQAGSRVRCMADWREYKAFGMQRGTNIYDFDQGRVYFWDGIAPTFNFYIDVPEGGINAMLGSRGKLYIWAGYKNQLLVYEGGDTATKLKDMPKMEIDKYSEIYPQGITMWQSLIRYGAAGGGDSTAVQKGVYTYGSTNLRYPEILTYDYPISTGTYSGVNTKVGLVAVVNKKLLIGWQDGVAYGMDYVDTANQPFPSAYIEFVLTDSEAIWKEKEAVEVDAVMMPLETGQSISLRYALNGSTTFTSNSDATAVGSVVSRLLIPGGRYNEAQVGLDITSGTTSPQIKGVVLISNLNESEQRYG